jgi:hypothetical protein
MLVALYVDPERGPYAGLLGSERCWGIERDGKQYNDDGPVVAHPPCKSWSRRFSWRKDIDRSGHDCGPRAVEQVRKAGGVIEHPAHSALWEHCKLPKPGEAPDSFGGFTIAVNQVDWGHPTVKPTWLYVCPRGPGVLVRRYIEASLKEVGGTGVPTHCIVRKKSNPHDLKELPKRLRHVTPRAFAVFLLAIATLCSEGVA